MGAINNIDYKKYVNPEVVEENKNQTINKVDE